MDNHNYISTELEPGKSGRGKKTPLQSRAISRTMLVSIALGMVAITAISSKFEGRIEFKLGIEGGQVLIDGSKPPHLCQLDVKPPVQ